MPVRIEREKVVGSGRRAFLRIEAKLDGRQVGYVDALLDERVSHIEHIKVRPRHRRSGIGTALLRRFVLEARRDGKEAITASVPRDNASSAGLFTKCGFTKIDDKGSAFMLFVRAAPPIHRRAKKSFNPALFE